MAVLVYSEIKSKALDRGGINVTNDAPVPTEAEFARWLNDAYATVWNLSGGRFKTIASATAWTSAQLATGQVQGAAAATDIEDIRHVWASTTSGSLGVSSGDVEVDRVELAEVLALRASSAGYPTYLVPKKYAVTRKATITPASVNLLQLDYWPGLTGFYLPIMYVPQFTPMDSATVTTPDVNDLESYDIALLTAAKLAQIFNRNDLVPGIFADLSTNTQAALERKLNAMLDAKQDA